MAHSLKTTSFCILLCASFYLFIIFTNDGDGAEASGVLPAVIFAILTGLGLMEVDRRLAVLEKNPSQSNGNNDKAG